MFQNDSVTLQKATETNNDGAIGISWSADSTVVCDVQYISKEKVSREYGLTDANEWLQVFDLVIGHGWVEGDQVAYDSKQWLVRKVIPNQGKLGASNHIYIVLSRVI